MNVSTNGSTGGSGGANNAAIQFEELLVAANKNKPAAARHAWAIPVKTSITGISFFGVCILVLSLLGFGLWASTAPLAGAAIASGVVAASGQNQTVQHLTGGIVKTINVREGDRVTKGQTLLTIDKEEALSNLTRLKKQRIALNARAARLEAERDNSLEFDFPEALIARAFNEGLMDDIEEQKREFNKRSERYKSERLILDQRIAAIEEQLLGLAAQKTASERQREVVMEDLQRKKKLLNRGLTNRSEYTALQRNEAELGGEIGGYQAEIGRARTSILEAREQQAKLAAQRAETAVSQLNEVRAQIADNGVQLAQAQAVLDRVVIRAPSDGIVVEISKNTEGSIIRAGEDILKLLPTSDELIVEARLKPTDVDVVTIGQEASLRFSALNSRTTPEVPATVTYVSADRLVDPVTQEPYFTARLKIADSLPPEIRREQIFPGMPVETYIKTDDRTFLEYLAKPIMDSFNRAFREE